MPTQSKVHRPPGWSPPKERERRWDKARPSAAKRGYTDQWRKMSKAFLGKHPLCKMCESHGQLTEAKEVDHIIPHRGNMTLFWDQSNWQGLCSNCHRSEKQRLENLAQRVSR